MTCLPETPRKIKIAINGYGRIGRCVARALYESADYPLELVAINEPAAVPNSDIARLTQYDSAQGRFRLPVKVLDNGIDINGHAIQRLQCADASRLPWAEMGVDIVLDCSGRNQLLQAEAHIAAGAKRVLFSSPLSGADYSVVYGYNHQQLMADAAIVSNASCTTNCLTLVLDPIYQAFGIEQGCITTVHAWTADQNLVDGWHSIPRRERAAPNAIVPTSSGAADGVMSVMPELRGKLDAHSLRVPINNMSLAEITLLVEPAISTQQLHDVLETAALAQPHLLGVSAEPLVSCDFIQDSRSAIIDKDMTKAQGKMLKILAWHDNEWAYACRMLDTTTLMALQASALHS